MGFSTQKKNQLATHERKPIVAPEDDAHLLSVLFFSWLLPLVKFSWQNSLEAGLIEQQPTHYITGADGSLAPVDDNLKATRPGSWWAVSQVLWPRVGLQFTIAVCIRILSVMLALCLPAILNALVNFETSSVDSSVGVWLVGALVSSYLGSAVLNAQTGHLLDQVALTVRVSLVSLITARQLKLPADALQSESERKRGLTLVTVDAKNVGNSVRVIVMILGNLIMVGVGSYILYSQVRAAFFAPLVLALASVAASTVLGKLTTQSQRSWLEATQSRIRQVSEDITALRSIRQAGLEPIFLQETTRLRKLEIEKASAYRQNEIFFVMISDSLDGFSSLSLFGLFSAFYATNAGNAAAFTSLSTLYLMMSPLITVTQVLPQLLAGYVSLKRIAEDDLPNSEVDRHYLEATRSRTEKEELEDTLVMILWSNASFKHGEQLILEDVDLRIKRGQIVLVYGPSESGKSTLLKSLLFETNAASGSVSRSSQQVAYCAQKPWLLNISIRENILLGKYLDPDRYSRVLEICCLQEDLALLPKRDNTCVGFRGSLLSSGQRKRVSLARAIYQDADLLLLDDIYSGLDTETASKIRKALFGEEGFLRQREKTVLITSNDDQGNTSFDMVVRLGNGRARVETLPQINQASLHALNNDTFKSETASTPSLLPETLRLSNLDQRDPVVVKNHQKKQRNLRPYIQDLGVGLAMIVALLLLLKVASDLGRTLWIKHWAADAGHRSPGYYVTVYATLVVANLIMIASAISIWILIMQPKASMSLHQSLLRAVERQKIWVIEGVCSSILNRFVQDMTLVDMELPQALLNASFAMLAVLGDLILLAAGSPYVLAVFPVLCILLWLLETVYLRASQPLRRIQLEAQAPIIDHFKAVTEDLVSVRCFNYEGQSLKKLDEIQEIAVRPEYLLRSLQSWMVLVLDLMTTGLAAVLAGVFVALRANDPGWVGVALTALIKLGQDIKLLVVWWTTLELSSNVISRTQSFASPVPPEGAPAERPIPSDWPAEGRVSVKKLVCIHGTQSSSPKALIDVSFDVEPGQKIMVLGRTGSGKSSLAASFLSLVNIVSGSIVIDGIEIAREDPDIVRQRIISVPQMPPSLHSANACTLLDPKHQHSASVITSVLESFGLSDLDLSKTLPELNLSESKQKLFGLAASALRPGKVVVIDEATASADAEVEERIVNMILSGPAFSGRTVIFITHSLHSIKRFDKVAVISDGRLLTYKSPSDLQDNEIFGLRELYKRD
ncbi:hypothetical protein AYL99_01760 [Fonsecaea erecta]|uniref:ABC transporter n=1 Tax=Fonsecaea erecta TaxID=1367422 RepID=A0A178ZTM2_9EURO|nr:hypothetical protein AYL99_01760 [Fonsecaea erecta]OAP62533.1 hypothetical protein AYL99_01760 [Fonsecaea erecta]